MKVTWEYAPKMLSIPQTEQHYPEALRRADLGDKTRIRSDLAPYFYPTLSSLGRFVVPVWARDAKAIGA